MNQKQLLLSDVPRDVIKEWEKIPVPIKSLRKQCRDITNEHPINSGWVVYHIGDQIKFILAKNKDLTLEQYAYSFLYFDEPEMRNAYKVIYDYFEKHQPQQKKEEITISLLDDYEDVSEVIVIEDDCQPAASSSQSTKDGRICGICFENEVDGIILPCAHMCCYQCASDERIKLCPEFSCRKPVERVIKGQFI